MFTQSAFTITLLSAVVVLSLSITAAAPLQHTGAVVDAHVHLTNISLIDYPWGNASLTPHCPCAPPCLCDWTPADYVSATSDSRIAPSRFVFMEVSPNASDWSLEVAWVQSLAAGGAPVAGIIAHPPPGFGTPALPDKQLINDIKYLLSLSPLVRGMRPEGVDPATLDVPTFSRHVSILASFNLTVDWLVSVYLNVSRVIDVVAAVPSATFIVNHIGFVPVGQPAAAVALWRSQLTQLASFPNVFVKISGVLQQYKLSEAVPSQRAVAGWVVDGITAFGYSRCMFAGNWFFVNWLHPPLLSMYSTWAEYLVETLAELKPSAEQLAELFAGTAERVYRLGPG